jgi:excisionase family DNA binding protein
MLPDGGGNETDVHYSKGAVTMQQESGKNSGLATVRQAAGFLNISVAKIYVMMEARELPYIKLGKSRRIAWAALHQLVARCTINAQGQDEDRGEVQGKDQGDDQWVNRSIGSQNRRPARKEVA